MSLLLAFGVLLTAGATASANSLAGGGYSSSYVLESVFTNKAAGESGQFSVRFFNDGTTAWAPGVVGLLVCLSDKTTCNVASPNAAYASGWTSSTVYATLSANVAAGSNADFLYNFTVPAGTAPGTAATFNGDVGLIATGTMLHPEGYYQINTTPAVTGALTISPTSASLPVGGQQQFTVTGAPSGSTTSWSVTGGCGAVTATGLFAATAVNSATQPCTVVASAGGLTASAAITVFGPATKIACSADKTTMVGASANSVTISGTLKDANDNTVASGAAASGINITFSNATPALLTPTAAQVVGTQGGVSSVAYTGVNNTTGTAQVSLSSGTLTGCTQLVTITAPGAAVKLSGSFSPNPTAADGVSTSRLRVDVKDAGGNRVTSDSTTAVSITRTSGSSVCATGSATQTVASGRTDFTVLSTTTPGTCIYDITANVTTISGTSATLTTVIVGAPSQLSASVSSSPASVTGVGGSSCDPTGAANCPTVTVTILDASGNRVTGTLGRNIPITATWTTSTSTGSGCGSTYDVYNGWTAGLNGAAATTGSAGATINSGNTAGWSTSPATQGRSFFEFATTRATTGCTLTFTSTGLSSTTAVIAFNPGPATGVACSFTPRVIINDGSQTSISTVNVVDANGNATNSGSFSTTFSRTTNNSGTTLLTTSPQNMTNGTVQFTVRSTTTVGTDTYTASATVTGSTASTNTCQITSGVSGVDF